MGSQWCPLINKYIFVYNYKIQLIYMYIFSSLFIFFSSSCLSCCLPFCLSSCLCSCLYPFQLQNWSSSSPRETPRSPNKSPQAGGHVGPPAGKELLPLGKKRGRKLNFVFRPRNVGSGPFCSVETMFRRTPGCWN